MSGLRARRLSRISLVLGVLISTSSSWAATVEAEPSPSPSPREESVENLPKNYVGGHRYDPSLYVAAPFITSHFSFGMGFSRASQTVVPVNTERHLELIAYAPNVAVQVALSRKFALNLAVIGGFVSGINTQSAIIYGATVSYMYGFGALYNLFEEDDWVLSLGFDLTVPKQVSVSPLRGAVENIRTAFEGTGGFVQQSESKGYRPSLRGAFTVSPAVGITMLAGYNFIEKSTETSESSNSGINSGLGLSLQLDPLIQVPIGVNLNFVHGFNITGRRPDTNFALLGLYATMAPRFSVGLEWGKVYAKVDGWIGSLTTRYHF